MHDIFVEDMDQQKFEGALVRVVAENSWAAWTLIAEVEGRGYMPVGVVFSWVRGRVIETAHIEWFPWASPRNIWEASLNFYDSVRKTVADMARDISDPLRYFIVLEFARFDDRAFFERLVDKKIMRKIGHVKGLYDGQTCVMFQTNSPVS